MWKEKRMGMGLPARKNFDPHHEDPEKENPNPSSRREDEYSDGRQYLDPESEEWGWRNGE